MNEESETVEENSCDATLEACDHGQIHTIDIQQVSTGAASCSTSGDDNLMRHIEEGQKSAISVMCTNLRIPASDLLTEDVTTHHEFMKVLADVAVSTNEYYKLSMVWKGHQSFAKKHSSISTKHSDAEKVITV